MHTVGMHELLKALPVLGGHVLLLPLLAEATEPALRKPTRLLALRLCMGMGERASD